MTLVQAQCFLGPQTYTTLFFSHGRMQRLDHDRRPFQSRKWPTLNWPDPKKKKVTTPRIGHHDERSLEGRRASYLTYRRTCRREARDERDAGRPPPRIAPGMAPARGVVAIIRLAVAARLTHVKARGASAGPRRMRWRRKGHYFDGQTAPLPLFRSTFCFAGVSLDLAPADRPLIHGSPLTLIGPTSAHEWPTNHRKRRSSRPHLHALLHRTLQNQTTNSPGGGTAKRPPTRKFLQRAAKPNQTKPSLLRCASRETLISGARRRRNMRAPRISSSL
jgi:hypothetical protein